MEISWEWSDKHWQAALAIINVTLGFIAYWFIATSNKAENYFKDKYGEQFYTLPLVVFQRFTGFVCLGILPAVITVLFSNFSWHQYGLKWETPIETWYWVLGLSAVIIPLNYVNAKKEDNLLQYPQIRLTHWSTNTFIVEYGSWILYLVGYEFLFRGLLLFGCQPLMGTYVSMVVNTSIYAIAHIPKGQKEAIGAIPLGLLLSYLTFKTGTLWIALIVHIVLALSNSFFSFRVHPHMRFVRNSSDLLLK